MILDRSAGLLLAATDLSNHLACAHLTQQRRAVALGERGRPRRRDDPHGDLIRRRGDEHERAQLDILVEEAGGDWVDLTPPPDGAPRTSDALAAAADVTAGHMRAGRRLIFQAALFDGRWQGRADFLVRVEEPSDLGDWSYEVVDTKLARHVRPATVHQLCLYSRMVGEIQGREPHTAHVILGDGGRVPIALERYGALHRHAARRLEATLEAGPRDTYPEPVAHCDICAFAAECDERRRADDHLSLVAGAGRRHRDRLVVAGVDTLAALAARDEGTPVAGIASERHALLHHQARLQDNARAGRLPVRRHLDPEAERGYARLPEPTAGDIFFDLEGDPYLDPDGGIEFLWGWSDANGRYECVWAHDRPQEREALQRFVDEVERSRAAHPGMHVFHYAPHEASALRRLAMRHGVAEDAIDGWLRGGVLVDLYAVVRQGLQVGEERYSLKHLERHHGFARHERTVRAGGGAIATYEAWCDTGDGALLDAIRAYNREDCESTRSLYRWLREEMRPEAEREHGVSFADLEPAVPEVSGPPAWMPAMEDLLARLHAGLPADPADDDPRQAERRLMAGLLLYHHRENKPQYWDWFRLRELDPEDLVEERSAVGLVELDVDVPPVPVKRSLEWTYRFPPQEFKLAPGTVDDAATGKSVNLVDIDDQRLVLRVGAKREAPTPAALIAGRPPDPKVLREALVELAEEVLDGRGDHPMLRALLRREPPRPAVPPPGAGLDGLVSAALDLEASCLPVQGPPGTGKTYSGARMVVAALAQGRRVALTANSHAAIQNLLAAVERHAAEVHVDLRGAYRGEGYASPHGLVEEVDDNVAAEDDGLNLVAGTGWLLARLAHRDRFDLLFVDEAGQMSLAGALAAGMCARNMVLLGDPQQLPQVNQAEHPDGAGASVLGHLLAGADTVDAERGVLLDVSWRMHPDVCRFVSERSYDGLLRAHEGCARRRVDGSGALSGAGLRVIEVAHEGRSQESLEEARAIAAACRELLGGGATVTDAAGATRPLMPGDVMVVAPYNMAVACIRREVPDGVRVGTVDRFQGQEAPVVFFAMTCSSGEDVPRGLDFVFDRNRLNVAVSRAECLAVLVHSPRLLDADCRTLEQMALVDGACRFVEMARR